MPMPTSLAPGYVKVTYPGTVFPHHMTIPVNYDGTPTPGLEPDILLKDASSSGIIVAIDNMFDWIKPFFPTSVSFGLAEAHTVHATTGLDTFIFGWNVGVAGTSAVARVAMSEDVFTFKLTSGGVYKLYLMEDVNPVNVKTFAPYASGPADDLADFMVGNSSPVYGRTNSYIFAALTETTKTNDTLRKQHGL